MEPPPRGGVAFPMRPSPVRSPRPFWPLLAAVVLADCSSKRAAVDALAPAHVPHPVVGDLLRFTLAYNEGSAMGLVTGAHARWLLALGAVVAIVAIVRTYRRLAPTARLEAAALALVAGGALGNLIDRVRWDAGVVDFIDVGVGDARFYVFNVADVAITVGVALLLWCWRPHSAPGRAA